MQPILRGLCFDQPRGATRFAEHIVPRTAAAGCRVAGDVLAPLPWMAANARRCAQLGVARVAGAGGGCGRVPCALRHLPWHRGSRVPLDASLWRGVLLRPDL